MNKHDIDKAYVSPYDQFLYAFDATHEKTLSQLKEIKKHQRIFVLRDQVFQAEKDSKIWDNF